MSYYARRDNQLNTTSSAGSLTPAATYTVYVLEPGAVVHTAASVSNTVRVYKGHGLAANDKFLVGASVSQFCTVSSIDTSNAAYDEITLSGVTTVTAAQGAVLINLGQDTGSASPNYDAAAIAIYNDPAGATTAITDSALTTDAAGNYGYWVAAGEVWELIVADNTPDDYIVGIYPYVKRFVGAASTDVVVESVVAGDANVRHSVDVAGKHQWGDGTNAVDTNLYRSAADTLKTDDSLVVGGTSTLVGNATAQGTLTVDGASTLTGAVSAGSTMGVTGKLTASGEVEIDGALNHDGSTAGFFGATPASQPGATDDIKDALTTMGLLQGTSATPLDLDGGTLTAGDVYSEGFQILSTTTGITASTTQSQGQQPLTTGYNYVSSAAVAGDAVTLPAAAAGKVVAIANRGGNNISVFPASGDTVNGGSVDAAYTQGTNTKIIFIANNDTNWETF